MRHFNKTLLIYIKKETFIFTILGILLQLFKDKK
jgi:hypothetical protein